MMMMSKCPPSRNVFGTMIRSRFFAVSQPVCQRAVSTQVKTFSQQQKSNEDEPTAKPTESKATTVRHAPPRRPLTQQFTHQITNQAPPLESIDLYETDLALKEFLKEENSGSMREMAKEVGTYHWFEQGHLANRHLPVLQQFDRYGQRIDEVQFHPAYHDLMQLGMRYGVSSL